MQSQTDIEERNLMGLLESFGSTFSLDDIANAYCEANYNVNLAAEILCGSNNEFKGASKPAQISPATSSASDHCPKSFDGKRNSGAGKSKFQPASLGTVAGVVGRDYIQPKTWTKPYQEVYKPLKLDAKELPESVIWGEKPSMITAASMGTMSDDVVNFLLKMLGDGFELDKKKIQDVLGKVLYIFIELSVYCWQTSNE